MSHSLLSKSKFRKFTDGENAFTLGIELSHIISSSSRMDTFEVGFSFKSVFSRVEHPKEFAAS